ALAVIYTLAVHDALPIFVAVKSLRVSAVLASVKVATVTVFDMPSVKDTAWLAAVSVASATVKVSVTLVVLPPVSAMLTVMVLGRSAAQALVLLSRGEPVR